MTTESHSPTVAAMTEDELRVELARLLPEQIRAVAQTSPDEDGDLGTLFWWNDENNKWLIGDTEWPYVCYLIRVKHQVTISVGWSEPWQGQARYILSWLETRKDIAEAKA